MADAERNSVGRFDCPQAGCESKGAAGLKSRGGLGAHLFHVHGVRSNGAAKPKPAKKLASLIVASGRRGTVKKAGPAPRRPIGSTRRAATVIPPTIDLGSQAAASRSLTTVALAVRLMDLPELAAASPDDLEPVFSAIISHKRGFGVGEV